jgi:hypothetical protein
MFSVLEAKKKALNYLADIEKEMEMPLLLIEDEVIESEIAYAFFYNSKDYIETGDISSCLAGNGPIIVLRNNGKIIEGGTDSPVEYYLDNLKKYGSLYPP